MPKEPKNIKAEVAGKKVSELTGTLKEYRQLGLDQANVISALEIMKTVPDTHEKKGYVVGYLLAQNNKIKIRRAVLEETYK